MKSSIRALGLVALAAWSVVWVWACLTGLTFLFPIGWALLIAALLAWLRQFWLLYVAAFAGAWLMWRWPILLALLFVMPRALLMLPGLISTYLAARRHPRIRWSSASSS